MEEEEEKVGGETMDDVIRTAKEVSTVQDANAPSEDVEQNNPKKATTESLHHPPLQVLTFIKTKDHRPGASPHSWIISH